MLVVTPEIVEPSPGLVLERLDHPPPLFTCHCTETVQFAGEFDDELKLAFPPTVTESLLGFVETVGRDEHTPWKAFGVTTTDEDGGPLPTELAAATLQVYFVPFVRPVMVAIVWGGVPLTVELLDGAQVTV